MIDQNVQYHHKTREAMIASMEKDLMLPDAAFDLNSLTLQPGQTLGEAFHHHVRDTLAEIFWPKEKDDAGLKPRYIGGWEDEDNENPLPWRNLPGFTMTMFIGDGFNPWNIDIKAMIADFAACIVEDYGHDDPSVEQFASFLEAQARRVRDDVHKAAS